MEDNPLFWDVSTFPHFFREVIPNGGGGIEPSSMGNSEFCVGDPETCACAQFSVYPTQEIFALF